MWVRTQSDAVAGDADNGGNLAAAEADVTRLRLVLEGSRAFEIGADRLLTPSVSVGLRHDGGAAETGTGLEVGGGVAYAGDGITVEGRVRALVAHEDSSYEEWGASGSLRIDPGEFGRGLSLSVAPVWGEAGSQAEQLWGLKHTRGLADDREFEPEQRIEAELGYGLTGPRGLGVVTPYTAGSWADDGGRTLRAGARWHVAPDALVGLEAHRTQSASTEDASNAVLLRTEVRW